MAVPARENPAIAERVARSGKALLLQKPLAEDLAGAQAIATAVERAGIVAAVNQQARWMPAAVAMRDLIARDLLGEVYQISFLNNVLTPWDLWPWIVAGERVEVLYHSIHYLDTVRALLRREPRLVFADGATLPGFQTGGETRTVIQLIFDGDLRATVMDNHHNIGGPDDQYATVRVEGTEGTAVAELGLNKNYPTGAPDSFRYMSRRLQPGTWISPKVRRHLVPRRLHRHHGQRHARPGGPAGCPRDLGRRQPGDRAHRSGGLQIDGRAARDRPGIAVMSDAVPVRQPGD